MDEELFLISEMDQLDSMLGDFADEIHRVAMKHPSDWTVKDFRVVRFALHASAARAAYIKGGREEDGEEAD